MADKTTGGADMKFHADTYGKVTGMMKWGTVVVVIIAAAVIWLIAH